MSNETHSGSRFIVDLGDVKLPSVVERQVEAEIQAIVLREIAENQLGSQGSAKQRPKSIWDNFGGGTKGLWPTYPDNPPDIFVGFGGGLTPLRVEDHKTIMDTLMKNIIPVLRSLPDRYKGSNNPRPLGSDVLQAALQVEGINDDVKARIQAVLQLSSQIELAESSFPEAIKRSMDDLRTRLAREAGAGKLRVLRDSELRNRHRDNGLASGMEIAARIQEDGEDSIYSETHSFFKLIQGPSIATARPIIDKIKDADTLGGTAGGYWGTFIEPGVGTAAGAVAGAIAASASVAIGEAAEAIWDAIWD